jgi:lipopolysaccharide export LptBFGC system permease protein LptF
MVTAFVGVGVYTFYASPDAQFRGRIVSLGREQQAIRNSRPENALTPADRAQIQKIADEQNRVQDASRASTEAWGGRTSIILVALATLAMAISLIAAAQLPVIGNGLLMGGVFTMLYGVGWVMFASGTSTTRFIVMTFALVITLALGYVRFVRRRAPAEAQGGGAATSTGEFADLEPRVRALEERMAQAASALAAYR